MINYFQYNRNTPLGAEVQAHARELDAVRNRGRALRDRMIAMKDGSDHAYLKQQLDAQDGEAERVLAELESCYGKLDATGQVTDVKGAMDQFVSRAG